MYTDNISGQIREILSYFYEYPLAVAVFTAFLIIAAVIDATTYKIPNKLNLFFFISRFALIPVIGLSWSHIGGAVFAFFVLLIPAMIWMKKMGGDIKCTTVIGLYVGFPITCLFLLLACVYFLLVQFVRYILGYSVVAMPLAPFLLASNITLIIAYYFLL